jgi:hypothetical protein
MYQAYAMNRQNTTNQPAGAASVPQPQGPTSVIRALLAHGADVKNSEGAIAERRTVQGSGHVRLSGRDATLLSQMRNQYRKVFGIYFDPIEFTGNDLYARATLRQCLGSGNGELSAIAAQFLDAEGKPRLHRRLGQADLDLDFGAHAD